MAYQAQEWTANALSVEFKIDRRTVAKRLERVKAHRVEGVAKYYLMVDAAPALLMPENVILTVTEDGQPIVFEVERARLTKEQADKTELENRAARRELVSRAKVEAGLAVMDLALKDRLLTVPMACAPEAVDAARDGGIPAAAEVIARHIQSALSDIASADVVARAAA